MDLSAIPQAKESTKLHKKSKSSHNLLQNASASKLNDSKSKRTDTQSSPTKALAVGGNVSSSNRNNKKLPLQQGILNTKFAKKLPLLRSDKNTLPSKFLDMNDKNAYLNNLLRKDGGSSPRKTASNETKENQEDFSRSYSIKYFGVDQDQAGVISKRVPLKPEDKSKQHVLYTKFAEYQMDSIARDSGIGQHQFDQQSVESSTKRVNHNSNLTLMMKRNLQATIENNRKKYEAIRSRSFSSDFRDISVIQKADIDGMHDQQNFEGNDDQEHMMQEHLEPGEGDADAGQIYENQNSYMMNQYMGPKEMYSSRTAMRKSYSIDPNEEQLIWEMRSKALANAKSIAELSRIERAFRGIDTIKCNMRKGLLNPLVTARDFSRDSAMGSRETIETQGLKNLIAERDNMSYTKLLTSIQRPELLERYQNRSVSEQPLAQRKVQKVKNIHRLPSVEFQSNGKKLVPMKGSFSLNPVQSKTMMYNSYMKITKKYDDELKVFQQLQNGSAFRMANDPFGTIFGK